MKKVSPLVGKQARVFGDGGWEFSGLIRVDKKDRIVLELVNSDTILIFKRHISAVLLPAEQASHHKQDKKQEERPIKTDSSFVVFKPATKTQAVSRIAPDDDLSEGGVSLPSEVLLGVHTSDCEDNVFSSYFGAATDGEGKSRLSVTSEEDDS